MSAGEQQLLCFTQRGLRCHRQTTSKCGCCSRLSLPNVVTPFLLMRDSCCLSAGRLISPLHPVLLLLLLLPQQPRQQHCTQAAPGDNDACQHTKGVGAAGGAAAVRVGRPVGVIRECCYCCYYSRPGWQQQRRAGLQKGHTWWRLHCEVALVRLAAQLFACPCILAC